LIKPIKGHNGYFVDGEGNVYSQWVNKGIHGLVKEEKLQKLKCSSANKNNHRMIRLGGRKGNWKLVHRLVYEAFNGKIPDGLVVRHKNDVADDNRIENLTIGTQKDNMGDRKRLGNQPYGEKLWNSKLTDDGVNYIFENYPSKTQKQISKELGVSRRAVGMVLSGETWTHIKREELI